MLKYVAAALLILLVLLQYRLWFGDAGVREVNRLHAEIEHQRAENDQLRERNRTLSAEVQDLKKGTTAIEERARTDLGMVGPNETFFQVVTPRGSAQTDTAQTNTAQSNTPQSNTSKTNAAAETNGRVAQGRKPPPAE